MLFGAHYNEKLTLWRLTFCVTTHLGIVIPTRTISLTVIHNCCLFALSGFWEKLQDDPSIPTLASSLSNCLLVTEGQTHQGLSKLTYPPSNITEIYS